MSRFDVSAADYLLEACREEMLRIFWLRGNQPLEFSALRIALEARGIEARDPNHWGSLAAALREQGVLEVVGRELAVAASRNLARNNAYRLTADVWAYVQHILAPKRGWPPPEPPAQAMAPTQTTLAEQG